DGLRWVRGMPSLTFSQGEKDNRNNGGDGNEYASAPLPESPTAVRWGSTRRPNILPELIVSSAASGLRPVKLPQATVERMEVENRTGPTTPANLADGPFRSAAARVGALRRHLPDTGLPAA